jgi:hypothetical protein
MLVFCRLWIWFHAHSRTVLQNAKERGQSENGGMCKENVQLNTIVYKTEVWGSDWPSKTGRQSRHGYALVCTFLKILR